MFRLYVFAERKGEMFRVKLKSGSFGEMVIERRKLEKLGYYTELDSYWHEAINGRQVHPAIAGFLRKMID